MISNLGVQQSMYYVGIGQTPMDWLVLGKVIRRMVQLTPTKMHSFQPFTLN